MPNFKVNIYHEEGGDVFVTADSKEAAEKMVQARLDYSGMADIDWLERVNYDVSFRDYGVATVADLSTSHEGGKL